MLYIVLSKNENYREAADLIVDLCSLSSFSANIVDIEKMGIDPPAHANTVFFLTNDPQVGDLVEKLLSKGVTVVNGDFFSNERSKSAVQKSWKLQEFQCLASLRRHSLNKKNLRLVSLIFHSTLSLKTIPRASSGLPVVRNTFTYLPSSTASSNGTSRKR